MDMHSLMRFAPLLAASSLVATAGCREPDKLPPTPIESTDGDTDGTDQQEEECPPCELDTEPCDEDGDDLFLALGLGCPDRPVLQDSAIHYGHLDAIAISQGIGPWTPTEGDWMVVMGTGRAFDLSSAGANCTATDVSVDHDVGAELPAPIETHDAGDVTCVEDPGLVGMGDCSNTIEGQFSQGGAAFDYSELRAKMTVPDDANSLKFDLAFFTTEYPDYVGTEFNDMFIGWLESEEWTGNVSFDTAGHPISVNAGFLDYKDDDGTLPALADTCMQGHGATKWLTSTAGVTPGEEVELILAIFDLGDNLFDSYVLLDNFRWGCDGCAGPTTVPEDDETDSGNG